MDALPEGCIATTLSLTNPYDACGLALASTSFHSAIKSDAVWERFLPPDYKDIISRSVDVSDLLFTFESKKELYFYLCDHPILIDHASKSFFLDKRTGKKCFMLGARDLMITWGDTSSYWHWISLRESRFYEVADLIFVCWFEVVTRIRTSMLSPNTTYSAFPVFKTNSNFCGFEYEAAEGSVRINGEKIETRLVCLDPDGFFDDMMRSAENEEFPEKRDDNWSEVLVGEFYIEDGQDCELEICLMEIKGSGKHGIIIEGIEIRPSTLSFR